LFVQRTHKHTYPPTAALSNQVMPNILCNKLLLALLTRQIIHRYKNNLPFTSKTRYLHHLSSFECINSRNSAYYRRKTRMENGLGDNHLPSAYTYCTNEATVFRPQKVLILTKVTRLEYERRTLLKDQCETEEELANLVGALFVLFMYYYYLQLRKRGSDYSHILDRHNYHNAYLDTIKRQLE
jgi:hypothetical protein